MKTPFTFKRFGLLAGKAARALAGMFGLTPVRLDLMELLLTRELAQIDLAARLCVCPSVVARLVKALLALGLVQKRTPDEDKRLRLVSLTSRGQSLLGDVFEDWPFDYGCSFQHAAEETLRQDFQVDLTAWKVTFDAESEQDRTTLVVGIYDAVRGNDYFDDWQGVPTAYVHARGARRLAAILDKVA